MWHPPTGARDGLYSTLGHLLAGEPWKKHVAPRLQPRAPDPKGSGLHQQDSSLRKTVRHSS
jgi:hypothetical protein